MMSRLTNAKLIDPDQALACVLEHAAVARARTVALARAVGLVLAREVRADRDYPPFDRAMMDGYAVRAEDAGRTLPVAGLVPAGDARPGAGRPRVEPGLAVEIMTGAACPEGTEAVVMKEKVRREGDRVTLPERIRVGDHVAARGSECAAGQSLLASGEPLTPLAVAVLATVGLHEVDVIPEPSLAAITTGDELARPGEVPGPTQIRDSNGPMLLAQARRAGLSRCRELHAADSLASLAAVLAECEDTDLVILTGGVSAGRFDLVPEAVVAWGAEVLFHKVSQKPGKPILFARRERAAAGAQLIFGLPGNPLSTHFGFHRYVLPAIRRRMGWRSVLPEAAHGRLAAPLVIGADRTLFVPLRVEPEGRAYAATPLRGEGSADIFATFRANAYLRLPPGEHALDADTEVDFEWMGERR